MLLSLFQEEFEEWSFKVPPVFFQCKYTKLSPVHIWKSINQGPALKAHFSKLLPLSKTIYELHQSIPELSAKQLKRRTINVCCFVSFISGDERIIFVGINFLLGNFFISFHLVAGALAGSTDEIFYVPASPVIY